MDIKIVNLEYLPEIAVALCFFPAGFHTGYMMFIQHFMERYSRQRVNPGADFAIYVSIGTAILTAIVLRLLKIRYKGREHFHHFKFLIGGILFLLISGVQFFSSPEKEELYLATGAIGQGIIYITGFCYTNIRIKHKRSVRLAANFLSYFFGMAFGVQLIRDKLTCGLILSLSSSVILMVLLAITTLKQLKSTKHSISLDDDINAGLYTHKRNQFIEYLQTKYVLGKDLYIGKVDYSSAGVFMLFTKLQCAILFHSIFLVKVIDMKYVGNIHLNGLQWAAFAGACFGVILLFLISARTIFLIGTFFAPIVLGFAAYQSYLTNKYIFYGTDKTAIPYYTYVTFLGAAYICSDLTILDTAPIKSAGTYLVIGFTMERLFIHFTQFVIPYDEYKRELFILPHIVSIGIILLLVFFITLFKMPNTYGKTLMQIKINLFWGIRYGYPSTNVNANNINEQTHNTVATNAAAVAVTGATSSLQMNEVPHRTSVVEG